MRNHNPYYGMSAIVSPKICEQIISDGKNQLKEDELRNINTQSETYSGVDLQQRKSKTTFLQSPEIYDILLPILKEANKESGWQYDVDFTESIQFNEYFTGAFCDWHSDGGGDNFSIYYQHEPNKETQQGRKYAEDKNMVGKVRKLSLSLNLSKPDQYDGGVLEIQADDGEVLTLNDAREQGTAVVFPSFTRHRITEVTRGIRYSVVLWALGRPFR